MHDALVVSQPHVKLIQDTLSCDATLFATTRVFVREDLSKAHLGIVNFKFLRKMTSQKLHLYLFRFISLWLRFCWVLNFCKLSLWQRCRGQRMRKIVTCGKSESEESRTFSGFRSQWTMFLLCKCFRATRI